MTSEDFEYIRITRAREMALKKQYSSSLARRILDKLERYWEPKISIDISFGIKEYKVQDFNFPEATKGKKWNDFLSQDDLRRMFGTAEVLETERRLIEAGYEVSYNAGSWPGTLGCELVVTNPFLL